MLFQQDQQNTSVVIHYDTQDNTIDSCTSTPIVIYKSPQHLHFFNIIKYYYNLK